MKVASVIFDLDGTLLDTLQDLTDSVNTVLARHNMPLRDIEEIRRFVGNGIPMLIRRAVRAGTSDEEIALCTQEMLDYYAEHCDIKTAPYPGVNELLSLLREKGIATAVVTNKDQKAAEVLCAEKFGDGLQCVVGARQNLGFKPAPDGVFAAMQEIGARAESTVYVGDSDVDMQTAANAGLPAVGVLWGFRSRTDLQPYQPAAMVRSMAELEKILLS